MNNLNDPAILDITIRIHQSGAMSVSGHIEDETYALSLLDAARDSVKSYHARARLNKGQSLITPEYDTPRRD